MLFLTQLLPHLESFKISPTDHTEFSVTAKSYPDFLTKITMEINRLFLGEPSCHYCHPEGGWYGLED
jgi:hypothetical protein